MTALAIQDTHAGCAPCALEDYGGCEAAARTRLTVRRGTVLFRQNDPFRAFMAVRRGSFKSVAVAPDGREQVLAMREQQLADVRNSRAYQIYARLLKPAAKKRS